MAGFAQHMAFVSMPGSGEWIVILIIGLLIFGRRLPDVARSLGKSVNEFKKGMREFQDSADEGARDGNKGTNEVASDGEKAAGVNDYGYQDPNAAPYGAGQYTPPESANVSIATQDSVSEPAAAIGETTEGNSLAPVEPPAAQDAHKPNVEPVN